MAPHCRGQGLGERLCRHLIEQATRMGATQVTLNVAITNEHAVRLYRRLGFVNAGPVNDRGIQAMTLSLQPCAPRHS
ncbi:GNAT family N-acetyltransferase [Kushneria sp. AK178]